MKRVLFAILIALSVISCKAQDYIEWIQIPIKTPPSIVITQTTPDYTSIYVAYVIGLGNPSATSQGLCWNTTGNPTTSDNTLPETVSSGADNITGLQTNTTYYIRGYIISALGTFYSAEVTRTTLNGYASVTTGDMADITATTATASGNVTSQGGSSVTERGVVWAMFENPTTSNFKLTSGSGTGSFTANLTNLNSNSTYYLRAYAINSFGTVYGNQVSFTTLSSVTVPTVTTTAITSTNQSSATSGGNVTSDGGSTVTARGIVWNTTGSPTISSYTGKTTDGTGSGNFSSSLTSLICTYKYYVRAYATNSQGTSYGQEISFENYPLIFIGNRTTSPCDDQLITVYATAVIACSDYNNPGCATTTLFGDAPNGGNRLAQRFESGKQLYSYTSCASLTAVTGTFYCVAIYNGSTYILYVSNGIIQSIESCP